MLIGNNPEVKRLMYYYLAFLCFFLLIALGLSFISLHYMQATIHNNNAVILACLIESYPEAEEAIIQQILSVDKDKVLAGEAIMSRYGLKPNRMVEKMGLLDASYWRKAIHYILLVISISMGFFVITFLFIKNHFRKIYELIGYAQKIQNRDYSLDIRDNTEGYISILKNEIYKITTMLREQAESLKEDKISLSNSIADISHQLKTPMTSLFLLNDLLYDNPPHEIRKDFLNKINNQLKRIDWLINSLLKLSKLDAGTVVMKKENVKVKELMDKAIEEMAIPIEIKGHTVTIVGDEQVSFLGDFNWTCEAIINILKNSIEHTPENGFIEISFKENPIYTSIVIKDSGTGISKEDIPYVFIRFHRGKNASSDSVGIGLAMANAIIEGQNGNITVKSEIDKGTEFTLKFYKLVT